MKNREVAEMLEAEDPLERSTDTVDNSDGSPPGVAPEENHDLLPLDVIFDSLSNERRRTVLLYLLSESESATLGELAEYIAGMENEKPEKALSSKERKRVYIALYQCHLPKLDDADVVEFDGDRKTVTPGPNVEQLTFYLNSESEDQRDLPLVAIVSGLTIFMILLHYVLGSNTLLTGLLFGASFFIVVLGGAKFSKYLDSTR